MGGARWLGRRKGRGGSTRLASLLVCWALFLAGVLSPAIAEASHELRVSRAQVTLVSPERLEVHMVIALEASRGEDGTPLPEVLDEDARERVRAQMERQLRGELELLFDERAAPYGLEVLEWPEPWSAEGGPVSVRLVCAVPPRAWAFRWRSAKHETVLDVRDLVTGRRFQDLAVRGRPSASLPLPPREPSAAEDGPAPPSSPPAQATSEVLTAYLELGVRHILPGGIDHLLFVLALVLVGPTLGPLIRQLTLFTLAHSLALALAVLGAVNLPGAVVEPLIALSIAYVGFDNLRDDPSHRAGREGLILAFGLLHGLGFAGMLASLGLPPGEEVGALLGFNVGVELGQLVVVLPLWALLRMRAEESRLPRGPTRALSAAIGVAGLGWTLARIFGAG